MAVMKAMVEGTPRGGYASSVTRAHYAAGSIYAFTFSEFLEGLICAAIELANGFKPPPPEGLSTEHVMEAAFGGSSRHGWCYRRGGRNLLPVV